MHDLRRLPFGELKGLYMLYGKHMAPGERQDINHEACPSGEDTKKRMNMRITDDGQRYLVRCNHCGLGGGYSITPKTRKQKRSNAGSPGAGGGIQCRIPGDACYDIGKWPARASNWLREYGITNREAARHRLSYSGHFGRVILPVYRDGKLKCFQTRRLEGGSGPKYLTYTDGTGDNWWYSDTGSDTLVITEDILSAIKVGRYVDSLALLSTSLSANGLSFIAGRDYQRCFIWLDHDNASVRAAERKLRNDVSVFIPDVEVVTLSDPKRCNDVIIRDVLQ